jgi:hypothetical protein
MQDEMGSHSTTNMMGNHHMDFHMMSPMHVQQTSHSLNAGEIDGDSHDHNDHLHMNNNEMARLAFEHHCTATGNYITSNGNNLESLVAAAHPSSSSFMMFTSRENQMQQPVAPVVCVDNNHLHELSEAVGDGTAPPSQGDSEATSVVDGRKRNRGQPRRKTYHKEEKLLIMWMKDHHISVEQIIQLTTVSKSNIDKWCAAKMRRQILEKYSQENVNCIISTAVFSAGKLHFYHEISQPSLVAILDKLHELQPEQLNIVIPIMLLERYDLHYPVKTRTIGMLASTQIMVDQNSDSEDELEDDLGKCSKDFFIMTCD